MDMNSFLVRDDKDDLILSVKNGDKCYHFPIQFDEDKKKFEIQGTLLPFPSISKLVRYYRQNGLPESSPDGKLIQLILPCSSGNPQPSRPVRKQHSYTTIDEVIDGERYNDASIYRIIHRVV